MLCAHIDLNHQHSFIKLHLGAAPEPVDTEALRVELAELQQKCNLLMEENSELRNKVGCRYMMSKCVFNQSCKCLLKHLTPAFYHFQLMQYETSPDNAAAD